VGALGFSVGWAQVAVLQPQASTAGVAPAGSGTGAGFYVPVTLETIRGVLAEVDAKPVCGAFGRW